MDPSEWLNNLDEETEARVRAADPHIAFRTPPSSYFGSVVFSTDLHQLLQRYQRSRQNPGEPVPDVYMLLAGSLRYLKEICCVAIVCTEKDRNSEPLREYHPFPLRSQVQDQVSDDPVLLLNNLVDESGKVIDFSGGSIPEFIPRFISNETWCLLSFVLYFDSPDSFLTCEKSDMSKSQIAHDGCLLKIATNHCPDDDII